MKKQQHSTEWFSIAQVLITTLLFMMMGTAMELYLLEHYEGILQLIPLLCIGASLLVFILLHVNKAWFILRAFQLFLILTALSGFLGMFLHLRANLEFEQEMKPTASGWDVFTESLSGALPTLAPGSMIVLALVGYSYIILLKQKR